MDVPTEVILQGHCGTAESSRSERNCQRQPAGGDHWKKLPQSDKLNRLTDNHGEHPVRNF
eukprot:scaffold482176_cov46-Prasinocladus_malaysianus.AAC.2